LKNKKPQEDTNYIVITVRDLYELTSRSPVTIQIYLRTICERFGKYVNNRCVIPQEEASEAEEK
jgi:hypothetical protein